MTPYERRKKLLKDLRAFLFNGGPEPEVDEYDLVEAFDFAGDNNDMALQQGIIEYAAKRYPDFDPITIRHAYNLLDNNNRELADAVAAKANPNMILSKLYRLRTAQDDGATPSESFGVLDGILKEHKELSDEDMITFIDLALSADTSDSNGEETGYTWLKDNLDTLRSHSPYLPTLLYEMAQTARDLGHNEDAAEFIEELTMIEPFELDYWELLAEVHYSLARFDDVQQDLEYALAINPQAPRSRMLQTNLKVIKGENVINALEQIDDLIISDVLDTIPLAMAVALLHDNRNDIPEADELIICYFGRYIKKFPGSIPAIDLILFHSRACIELGKKALDAFWENGDEHSELFWWSWAQHHIYHNNYEGSLRIYETFLDHGGELKHYLGYLKSMYFTNQSGKMLDYIVENQLIPSPLEHKNTPVTDGFSYEDVNSPIMIRLLFIMALVRCNNNELALKSVAFELKNAHHYMEDGNLILNTTILGFTEILKKIRRGIKNNIYPDEFDPLLMPSNLKVKS